MKNICCFAGHGKLIYGKNIKNQIFNKCRELITDFGVNKFWVGNYGSFDKLAAEIVRELKQQYPNIELNLIIPYLTKEINDYKEQYDKAHDNIIIAPMPMGTPNRYRILFANRYMVDKSRYLVAYVNYLFGGAAKTLEYAKQKSDIEVFNFGEILYY